ncbi:MAG: outer membrane protein assembly factor BamD [Bdellovibrionota bacterium]
MEKILRIASLFLLSFSLFFYVSCSGKDIDASDPHEFNSGPVVDTSEPIEELVKKANRHYEKKNYRSALKFFDKIYKREPYGRYALYAKTKMADAYFENKMYEEAVNNYYDLVKSHIGNYNKEYAIYMTGLSNLKSFKGTGRNTTCVKKAIEFFDVILNDYPNSKYTLDAKKYKLECYKILAKREKEILKYYKKQGDTEALKARELDFKNNWEKYLY